jgi:hypothetical protein
MERMDGRICFVFEKGSPVRDALANASLAGMEGRDGVGLDIGFEKGGFTARWGGA